MDIRLLPAIFGEVVATPLFWEALQRAESDCREVRFTAPTSLGAFAFGISYANAVSFSNWFGNEFNPHVADAFRFIPAEEYPAYTRNHHRKIFLMQQLLDKLSLIIPGENFIEADLVEEKYGAIAVRFDCAYEGEDSFFRIQMCNAASRALRHLEEKY